MEKLLKVIETVNGALNSFAWGPIMLLLLVGTGIFLTVRTRCIQVTKFGYIMKNTIGSLFKKKGGDHGANLSPFQAVTTAMAATVGTGNIAQSSEIAGAMQGLVGLDPLITGIILAVVVAIVVIGGVQRIGQVTSYMVPFMSIFYILAGIAVIALRITDIPAVFVQIFSSAFSLKSVGGGIFGYAMMVAMRQGVARGVFSNEAGLGSAPIAHATSSTEEPAEQAMWGVFEVFVDTIIICTITALTVLLSGLDLSQAALATYASKGAAAVAAFNSVLPGTIGGTVIQISLLFFALSTIISWSYYGERCWGYLTNNNKVVNLIYKVIFVLVCIVGATGSGTLMWDIADTLNGLMALPNLIALLLLSGTVARITKDYFRKDQPAHL